MTMRPLALLVPLLGVLLAVLSPFPKAQVGVKRAKAGAAARATGPWGDARVLADRMEEACTIANEATGSAFVEPPTVRVSSPEEIAAVVRADMATPFRTLGAVSEEQIDAMSRDLASHVVAQYDPQANVVLLVPGHAAEAAARLGDPSLTSLEVLRLLLVRMAVIAQDRQLYTEWKTALDGATTPDAVLAAGAVLEGHAQYATERVAEHWQIPAAFASLVTLLTAGPPAARPLAGPSAELASSARFAIVDGHAFVKAVAKKRGRTGVIALLKAPPPDRSAFADPTAFVAPKPKPAADKAPKALDEFRALAAEGAEVSAGTLDADAAYALLAPVQRSHCATVLAGFQGGDVLKAGKGDDEPGLTVSLLEFRTDGLAEAYVGIAKGAAGQRGLTVEEGAGRDGGLAGFAARGKLKEGERDTWRQATHEGRYVLVVETDDDAIDRERQDDALEAASEVLRVAQGGRNPRRAARER